MIIVTCIPAPGFDFYRCGWREEVRDGRKVRVGLCWKAGPTELADDELTQAQIAMLENDPGQRIKVKRIPGVPPDGGGKKEPEDGG